MMVMKMAAKRTRTCAERRGRAHTAASFLPLSITIVAAAVLSLALLAPQQHHQQHQQQTLVSFAHAREAADTDRADADENSDVDADNVAPQGSCLSADEKECALRHRKRSWIPPVPLGPAALGTARDADAEVDTPFEPDYGTKGLIIPREELPDVVAIVASPANASINDFFADLLDSLSVQGLEVHVLQNASSGIGSNETRKLAASLLARTPENPPIILYVGTSDALVLGERVELARKFLSLEKQILFPASIKCLGNCAMEWPSVEYDHGRYMVPNIFLATATKFAQLVAATPDFAQSPQLKLTDAEHLLNLYLTDGKKWEMGLDTNYRVFLPLFGFTDEWPADKMRMLFSYHGENDVRVFTNITNTHPAIVVAATNRKLHATIANYAPLKFHPSVGCLHCAGAVEYQASEGETTPEEPLTHPSITIGVLVNYEAPFFKLMLDGLANQSILLPPAAAKFSDVISEGEDASSLQAKASHARIVIAIMSGGKFSEKYQAIAETWAASHEHLLGGVVVESVDSALEGAQRIFEEAEVAATDHLFVTTNYARLENSNTLSDLAKQGVHVLAPLLARQRQVYFSNFWGAVQGDRLTQCADDHHMCALWSERSECTNNPNYMLAHCAKSCGQCVAFSTPGNVSYARGVDYLPIVSRSQRGLWAQPVINDALLLSRAAASVAHQHIAKINVGVTEQDEHAYLHYPFGVFLLLVDIFNQHSMKLRVDNEAYHGSLIDPSGFLYNVTNPDLYLMQDNPRHWRDAFIHRDYNPRPDLEFVQGRCWDIYNFPLFTEDFCAQLIELAESFDLWSGGGNKDERIKGGYEPVPTRDIHFNQMGFDRVWYQVLKKYVAPIVEKQWVGYTLRGHETLDFIVKYEPTGQPFLRKHHDASTFSMNVALNRIGIDFEGGGTRFTRQNCTVLDNSVGHALVHPGRLTHQHEGLYVTKGVRYIIVSFVDQM